MNFGGSYPQNLTHYSDPQKANNESENASFEPSTVKIHPGVRPGSVPEKPKSQNRTTKKKAQQRNISHIWKEAPAKDTATKFGTEIDVQDTRQILRWKFKGFGFHGGRILAFSIDFAYGP